MALVGLLLATVILYASSLTAGYAFDDFVTIKLHPGVQGTLSFRSLFLYDYWGLPLGQPDVIGTWRPVTTFSFWIDQHIGGGSPRPFHITNLLLFLAILIVADRLLRRWGGGGLSAAPRLLTLGAFAALAIHVDVVPSIMGRSELLATLFSVIAVGLGARRRHDGIHIVGAGLALVGAVLSKESASPIPVLASVLALRNAEPASRRRAVVFGAVALGVLAALFAFRIGRLPFSRPQALTDNLLNGAPLPARLVGAAEVLCRYLEHTFVPTDLCPDYSFSGILPSGRFGLRAAVGTAIAILGVGVFVASWRRRPHIADALLTLGASYVAVSHVIIPGTAIVADRLFFAPSLWLLISLGLGAGNLPSVSREWRFVLAAGACIFTLGQGALTFLSSPIWHDQRTLAIYSIRACPNVARIRLLRAAAAAEDGDAEEGAWSTVVGLVIRRRFPTPVARDAFPASLDDEPVRHRFAKLLALIGDAELRGACDASLRRLQRKRMPTLAAATAAICRETLEGTPVSPPAVSPRPSIHDDEH